MSGTRARWPLFTFAAVAWFGSFAVLARLGTWTTFAVVGVVVAAPLIQLRLVPPERLTPNKVNVGVGLASGLLMVAFTHLAFRVLSSLAPDVGAATGAADGAAQRERLFRGVARVLIVLIASCEEILFRGALPGRGVKRSLPFHSLESREIREVIALAAAYALTTTPLRSPLLAICAVLCGSFWGVLGLATGSLVAPLLAHVIWDLGVLIVWPLLA